MGGPQKLRVALSALTILGLYCLVGCGDPPEWFGSAKGPTTDESAELIQLWEREVDEKKPLNADEVKRIQHLAYLLLPDLRNDPKLDGLRWVVHYAVAKPETSAGFGIALCPASEYEEGKPLQFVKARILISAQYDPTRPSLFPRLPQWTPGMRLELAWLLAGKVEILPHIGGNVDAAYALVWQIRYEVMAMVGRRMAPVP